MDLIRGVGFRSGGRGDLGARDGGGTSPELCSAADGRRRKPNPVFPGSIRVVVGSRSIGGELEIHLCPQVGRFLARLRTRGGAGCVRRSIDGARCPACQSSLRPNWSGANGGVGFWGAHRGGLVDGFAAQGTGGEVWAAKSTRSPGRSRCGRRGRRRKVRGGSWR